MIRERSNINFEMSCKHKANSQFLASLSNDIKVSGVTTIVL